MPRRRAVTGRELKSGCRKYGRRFGNTSPSPRIPFHTSRAPDTRHVSRSAVLLRSTHSFVYGRLAADAAGWAISLADRWEAVQKCAPSSRGCAKLFIKTRRQSVERRRRLCGCATAHEQGWTATSET